MTTFYDLEQTLEAGFMGYPTMVWTTTACRLPEAGQRVVWSGLRGNQVFGEYQGDNQWLADTDETHPSPYRIQYTPSIWRVDDARSHEAIEPA